MSYYTILKIWNEIKDSLQALPEQFKFLISIMLMMLVGASLLSKAKTLAKVIILAGVIYAIYTILIGFHLI